MSNKLALFAFIKDESDIIESFIQHHIDIFDEITIIDNGSSDNTIDLIKKFEQIKVVVDPSSFALKGEICTDIMKQSSCDLLIPLDADEQLVFDDGHKISKDPKEIRHYLQNLSLTGAKYKVNKIYNRHPDNDGWYAVFTGNTKMIFPKKTFMYTDHGFHRGRTTLDGESNFSDPHYWRAIFRGDYLNDKIEDIHISYLHYHFRSKESWLKNTEKKLRSRIGEHWNNLKYLREYKGPSIHIKNEYLRFLETGIWHNVKKEIYIQD